MPLSLLFAFYIDNNSFVSRKGLVHSLYLKTSFVAAALPIFFTVSLLGFKYFFNAESIYYNQML